MIDVLIRQHDIVSHELVPVLPDVTLSNLRNLITYINKFNSLSTIGTMEFTDMIAKFGLNRTVCNYKYQDPYLKTGSVSTGDYVVDVNMTLEEYKKYINHIRYELYGESVVKSVE